MSGRVREGQFDVAIAAGPGIPHWPSVGARAISTLCSEMGLRVGVFGGDSISVRGVLPLPGTGGILVAEDVQRRIHRIRARAIVRVSCPSELPDPFPGWRSEGLIPYSTANRLRAETGVRWDPATVILGTGNRALRFATSLLDSDIPEVYCIETFSQWGSKRFSGWEVERRRFEMRGGKVLEARPVQLTRKAPLLWEFKVQDAQGVRVLEVARVVSAGPFRDLPEVREYPRGSFLFEMDQTASLARADDIEGWAMEEERGRWLGGKIARALTTDLGSRREDLEKVYRRARGRLRRYLNHRAAPFTPSYQGKWTASSDSRIIREFSGVPREGQKARPTASIECFEEIPCNLCESACPENAIHIGKVPRKEAVLTESACTGCGICVSACPSRATLLIHEKEDRSVSELTFAWDGKKPWAIGEFAVLVNRKGESLGSGRVAGITAAPEAGPQLVRLEVPTHLLWEARGIRKQRPKTATDEIYLANVSAPVAEKVEITLNGEKRLVRPGALVSAALFEIGQSRPEDNLNCADGSCGLCGILVDGVKKLACQTEIRKGMAIKVPESFSFGRDESALCPCLDVKKEQVLERLQQGNLHSPEAVLSVSHLGEGKCHGRLCMAAFRRLLLDQGLDSSQWIDWRFPWSEWELNPS